MHYKINYNSSLLHYFILSLTIIYEAGAHGLVPYPLLKFIFVTTFLFTIIQSLKSNFNLPPAFLFFITYTAFYTAYMDHFMLEVFFEKWVALIYIVMMFSIFYNFLRKCNFEVHLRYFIKFSYFLALIAIFQVIIGFLFPSINLSVVPQEVYMQSDGLIRGVSFFTEPSHLAMYLVPSLYMGIMIAKNGNGQVVFKKHEFIVIFIAEMLTFSVNGYLAVLLIYLIHYSSTGKLSVKHMMLGIVSMAFILLIMINISIFQDKLFALFSYKLEGDNVPMDNLLGTAGMFYFNTLALLEAMKQEALLGMGFENFHIIYVYMLDKIFNIQISSLDMIAWHDYNGSSSGWIRIIVEFGIIGFLAIIGYLFSKTIFNRQNNIIIIANQAFLFYLIFVLIRFGGISTPYLYYFFAMLLVSYHHYKANIEPFIIRSN